MNVHEILAASLQNRSEDKFVQKVKNIDEINLSKLVAPCIVQRKEDGVYCAIIFDGTDVLAVSRTGKPLSNITHPCKGWFSQPGVYICEVTNSKLSLEELSGVVNPNRVNSIDKATEILMSRYTLYWFHDYIRIPSFIGGAEDRTYTERWCNTQQFVVGVGAYFAAALVQTVFLGADFLDKFERHAQHWINHGAEGAVLKQSKEHWKAGAKDFRMVKRVRGLAVDLECTGFEYGKGKREGGCGALVFQYKGKEFRADLGKGWTDALRAVLTPENTIGKVFCVKALQESSQGVLRLPKVQEKRIDKGIQDDTNLPKC